MISSKSCRNFSAATEKSNALLAAKPHQILISVEFDKDRRLMYFKTAFGFVFSICLIACAAIIAASPIFSQTPDTRERPTIKNFGKSLERKKKNGSENNQPAAANSGDEDVIKVETNLVRSDVLVIDQRGRAISGLKKEDFVVTENDVPQEIGTFSLGDSADVPRSIVLIIDYSGSQLPFIKNSVEAAKVLVDKLNPRDRMAIVTDDVKLLAEFTDDKELLKKKLDSLVKEVKSGEIGKSLQYSALMATLNEMFDDEDIRPIIIFQTDGDQAFDILREDGQSNQPKTRYTTTFTIADLFGKIEKSRATIYSVVSGYSLLGLSPEKRLEKVAVNENYLLENAASQRLKNYTERLFRQQTSMAIVARASGGFTEALETPEQADAVYSRIFAGITERYLIGYYPANQTNDGKRHNFKIEVRGHPEYIVWGRKFYFAPAK